MEQEENLGSGIPGDDTYQDRGPDSGEIEEPMEIEGSDEGSDVEGPDESDEDDLEEDGGEDDDDNGEDGEDDEEGVEDDEEDDGEEDEVEEEEEDDWETLDEKCPVCLDAFRDKEVGTPESCDHVFCLDCILEWSRNINTCPVDRILFRSILVRHSLHSGIVRRIEVDETKPDELDEETVTYCEVCGRCDREDRLLLCDGCDAGYHCECLDPPLEHIPIEEWYCPECVAQNRHQEESSEDEPEVIEPALPSETRERTRRRQPAAREHPPARAIARTHISERVLARINRAREAERRLEQSSTSGTTAVSGPRSTSATSKKRKTTKRKTGKKRKTTKKRKTSKTGTTTTSGKGVKRRKFKRRKKRRSKILKRVTKAALPKTIRERIAGKLNLIKPRSGSMMPDIKVKGQQNLGHQRYEIGAASLTITGSDNMLDISEAPSTSVADIPSSSASTPRVLPESATTDLLGSIFSGQDMLHMPSKNVIIHRDGSLSKITRDSQDNAAKLMKSLPRQKELDSEKGRLRHTSRGNVDKTKENAEQHGRAQESVQNSTEAHQKDAKDSHKTINPPGSDNGSRVHMSGQDDKRKSNQEAKSGSKNHRQKKIEVGSPPKSEDTIQDDQTGFVGHQKEDPKNGELTDECCENAGALKDDDGIEEVEEGEEMVEQHQLSDTEKGSGKHEGSITCRASSSSFEESHSEEEGIVAQIKSPSRWVHRRDDQRQHDSVRKHQDQRHANVLRSSFGDKARRKFSVEEGLIEDDGEAEPTLTRGRGTSVSEEEGLIEDEFDQKASGEKQYSDEGLIAEDDNGSKPKPESDRARKYESSTGRGEHSSAEEGEVKTDEEEGTGNPQKKRKRERKRLRNKKDTRTVVIDSEMSLSVPKRPLMEIQRAQKVVVESRGPDIAASRQRELERHDIGRGEHGVFGDLRHVIQVKRDVPYKRPSRYEAYWTQLERQRAAEAQLAKKALSWESREIYERPYLYEDEWNRMAHERKPLESQWENFTIHRERSPVEWRKERDGLGSRVEAERRIEMVQHVDRDRRLEANRRVDLDQHVELERRVTERKVDVRKVYEREKKLELSRVPSRMVEVQKGKSNHKKDAKRTKDTIQKSRGSKLSQQIDAEKKHLDHGSDSGHRSREGKLESNPKISIGHHEKVSSSDNSDRDKRKRERETNKFQDGQHRKTEKPYSAGTDPMLPKPSKRDKDQRKDRHDDKNSETNDRKPSKEKGKKETSKKKSSECLKERLPHREDWHKVSPLHGRDSSASDNRHRTDKHIHRSVSRSMEQSASRAHSERSSKHSRDHAVPIQEHVDDYHSDDVLELGNRDKCHKSDEPLSGSRKDKEKNHKNSRKKSKDLERKESSVQQATSTCENQTPLPGKSTKRMIRARSPSTSHTGETGDELETSRPSVNQLPITVPATEMVAQKAVTEKVKKKKKDKTKKTKKANESNGLKGKKAKKAKAGKTKKHKVTTAEADECAENIVEENIAEENVGEENDAEVDADINVVEDNVGGENDEENVQEQNVPENVLEESVAEEPRENEEIVKEPTEDSTKPSDEPVQKGTDAPHNKRPAESPVTAESAKKTKMDEPLEKPTEVHQTEEKKDKKENNEDDDSSDIEMIVGPVTNIYEVIDLSQISSDEETFQEGKGSGAQAKDSNLYDPFDPTASPDTISSPDASPKHTSQRRSVRSKDRSRSPQRIKSPMVRRSSARRSPTPKRHRSISPQRRSPPRQKGSSRETGYSSRRRSVTPPRKNKIQKRRSPSPRRISPARKHTLPPSSSSRSQRRPPSPKRHISPWKRSMSPRRQISSRTRTESPRRRSKSPIRSDSSTRRQASSTKKSLSPRRHLSVRARSPKQRSPSPRHRPMPKKRSFSPRKHSVSPRKKSPSPRRHISPKRRHVSPKRREPSPRRRQVSPRKQIESSRKQYISPRRSISPHQRDYSPSRRSVSSTRSNSTRSSSSSSRSSRRHSRRRSRSLSSSSSWTSSTRSWSSSSRSRSLSRSRSRSISRTPSPRRWHYSRDRSSSSFRSESSYSSERTSSPEQRTPPRQRSPTPERMRAGVRQSPTQTSFTYRQQKESEKMPPVQPRQELPDSTQGSFRVAPSSPTSPDQTMAPATSTTDVHLTSKATSQISHILGQLASNPAIQSALNSANLLQSQQQIDTQSSDGSISEFLKSSEASFASPMAHRGDTRDEADKDLQSLADVTEDNIESSAVDLYNKNSRDRYLKKLQHQERVVEEVKLALKPYYQKREVNKDDYKEILRKSVNQVCHSKSGEINPVKIKKLIEGYVKKFRCKKKMDEKKETARPDLTFRLLTKS